MERILIIIQMVCDLVLGGGACHAGNCRETPPGGCYDER